MSIGLTASGLFRFVFSYCRLLQECLVLVATSHAEEFKLAVATCYYFVFVFSRNIILTCAFLCADTVVAVGGLSKQIDLGRKPQN